MAVEGAFGGAFGGAPGPGIACGGPECEVCVAGLELCPAPGGPFCAGD